MISNNLYILLKIIITITRNEVKPAIPYRVLSSLMGHDLQTHLKYYGGWSKEEENKNAMQLANQSINGQLTQANNF